MPAITSNQLARKPAICGIEMCGASRVGGVPSKYDVQGIGIANIVLRWKESTPIPVPSTHTFTEEAR
jgi:hypothetical protein